MNRIDIGETPKHVNWVIFCQDHWLGLKWPLFPFSVAALAKMSLAFNGTYPHTLVLSIPRTSFDEAPAELSYSHDGKSWDIVTQEMYVGYSAWNTIAVNDLHPDTPYLYRIRYFLRQDIVSGYSKVVRTRTKGEWVLLQKKKKKGIEAMSSCLSELFTTEDRACAR